VLTADAIKPFLAHADPDVRDLATRYFGESWSQDPDVLPRILDACEQYGFHENLYNLREGRRLVLTDSSLDRLLGLLASVDDRDHRVIERLNELVAHAPGELLRARREALEGHPRIPPPAADRLRRRQEFLDWTGERLWDELQDFARRSEDKQYVGEIDHDYAEDLVDALGRHDVPDAATICRLLGEAQQDPENSGWLETFLVDLAGRRRLREAVPVLVAAFYIDSDYLLERASEALARIGDLEAVRLVHRSFAGSPFDFRLYGSTLLGKLKHPESEAALLEFLEVEPDGSLRMWICAALCELVSERSVEAVRREIARGSSETFRELSAPALAVATILGSELPPEAAAWQRERVRQRAALKRALAELGDLNLETETEPGDTPGQAGRLLGQELGPPVTEPIRNSGARVGRNDPCPCGSGKKFKKCCGRSG
jgi:HEAT repeat protein